MNVGGFFQCVVRHYDIIKHFKYILKIHTKRIDEWRDVITNPLCGSLEQIGLCLGELEKPGVNLVGGIGKFKNPDLFGFCEGRMSPDQGIVRDMFNENLGEENLTSQT